MAVRARSLDSLGQARVFGTTPGEDEQLFGLSGHFHSVNDGYPVFAGEGGSNFHHLLTDWLQGTCGWAACAVAYQSA